MENKQTATLGYPRTSRKHLSTLNFSELLATTVHVATCHQNKRWGQVHEEHQRMR